MLETDHKHTQQILCEAFMYVKNYKHGDSLDFLTFYR
jgi:hypothetical protein